MNQLCHRELLYSNQCNYDLRIVRIAPRFPTVSVFSGSYPKCSCDFRSEAMPQYTTENWVLRKFSKNQPSTTLYSYSSALRSEDRQDTAGHILLYKHRILKDFREAYRKEQYTAVKGLQPASCSIFISNQSAHSGQLCFQGSSYYFKARVSGSKSHPTTFFISMEKGDAN